MSLPFCRALTVTGLAIGVLTINATASRGAGLRAPTGVSIPFRQALTAAWNNDPIRQELAVNASSARARASAARSWFSGGPSFTASYYDDRLSGTNVGYITYEGVVSVPLWLPGQGTATETVAKADVSKALGQVEVERLSVAVRVLQQTEASTLAQRRLTIAKALVKSLERMEEATRRSCQAGQGTSSDVEAVTAQLADARSEVAMAEAAREETASALVTLIGEEGTPDLFSASLQWLRRAGRAGMRDVEERDPRVISAHREVVAANAQMRLTNHSYMPNPEVGLVALDQGQYASPWATQVGVTIRMALPSDVQNTPMISAAQNRLAAASRAEVTARRAVHDELVQVVTRIDAAKKSFALSQSSASALLHRADALERSWVLGETSLIEALRARNDAWHALQLENQAEIGFHSAIIRLCIATGTLP